MLKLWLKRPLWQRVASAFLLGIIFGSAFGEKAIIVKPLGDIYLNLMRMVVIPLVFFSIASSIAQLGESKNMTRLFLRTIIWFFITSGLAVIVALLFGHLISPGMGIGQLPLGDYKPEAIPSTVEVLVGIIPSNPIKAMSEAKVLQVLFFSALVGAALLSLGQKAEMWKKFIDEGAQIVFRITRWILQLTPLGTFGLISWVVGHYGFSSLLPLGKFIIALYAACIFHIFFVYGGLLKLHGLRVGQFFRKALPAQQMAFATASSMATMPLTLSTVTERLGVPKSYANLVVPLGASIKMDGCGAIYPVLAALFIAQYFGLSLELSHYALLAFTAVLGSIGTAGVPGTAVVMLTLVLSTVGLPLEGISYIVAIDRILDMIRTATNVSGQMVVPVLVAKRMGILREAIYNTTAFVPQDEFDDEGIATAE